MAKGENRTARIEARISPEALAVVKRAAELEGRSLSDFIVAAARDAAHRTIAESQWIHLSLDEQRRFVDCLLTPPEVAPAPRHARASHERLIVGRGATGGGPIVEQ